MAITDISISEELKTNAPSIKYSGNEGPKSPQEIEMMASVDDPFFRSGDEDEHSFRMFNKPYKELNPDELEEFFEEMRRLMNKFSKGPILPSPEDPVNPFGPQPQGPVLPNRQMAAYGGIMGLDGRKQYGLGSKLKKFARKIIPNEVAQIAETAAPFVAPFNPIAAGLMKGVGGFDRTGSIGDSLKSGLLTYGLGQGARYLGGAEFQGLQNPFTRDAFSMPTGSGGIKNLFKEKATISEGIPRISGNEVGGEQFVFGADDALGGEMLTTGSKVAKTAKDTKNTTGILKTIKDFALDNKLLTGLAAGTLGATALMGNMEPEELQDMQRGEGLDVEGIRAEVIEAFKDPSGEKLAALRSKYPFLGTRESKNIDAMGKAMGGRIGKAEGGIMDLGGMEKDYRAEGGFVPIGREEKADDVPARLSVNEFVFTADAVRNAGGGDIDKGAEVMENMMKNLEAGGQVSQESQGIQSLRAGGRAGFANGLSVDTDKVIEDIKKFSIPGLIGRGVKAGADKISDMDLETIIKVVAKAAPGGMVVEKVTEFLIDRYGMSPDEAQMRVVNKLGTDANEGFKQPSGTSDEGYRMVGIESSAEDTSDIPMRNRLRNVLSEVPSIEMPRPEKRFPEDNRYYPDGPGKFPERKPFVPGEGGDFKREPFRPRNGSDFELLREMFDTSERLSEVVG